MTTRRKFLKQLTAAGGAVALSPWSGSRLFAATQTPFFRIHPFIEHNPNAVFIMLTDVDQKMNSAAMRASGNQFGTSAFISAEENEGNVISVNSTVVIKPNLTARGKWQSGYTTEGTWGVVTDCYFVEGVIESLFSLGVQAENTYVREVNNPDDWAEGGYVDMAARKGVELRDLTQRVGEIDEQELIWMDIPGGIWFSRIPYLRPVNQNDAFFLNIGKLKTHTMGMTLTAKNLQGTIAHNYQQHCREFSQEMDINAGHMAENARLTIQNNYTRHMEEGIPRWDRPGEYGGILMETWASRCLDNLTATKPNLNIIEGIVGRDGDFVYGPNDGFANDYMTNVIIFGKNPLYVDIIGTWIGGHEPGNFGLFHLAKERGFIDFINPDAIPLYLWNPGGEAELTTLNVLPRFELKTKYLRRDYNDQDEPFWHLVNEPFDYESTPIREQYPRLPVDFSLKQNYPNPFNSRTTIEFEIPSTAPVQIDVFNTAGQRVAILTEKIFTFGRHMINWDASGVPSGVYFYRLQTQGARIIRSMLVLK